VSRERALSVRKAIIVGLLLWWSSAVQAQSPESSLWFVRGGIAYPYIVPTNPFGINTDGAGDPIHWAPNLTIEVGRRTDGTSAWHELYNAPSYGFGFSIVQFPNRVANGRPLEAYTFFSWPFARLTDKLQVMTDFGMGLSWRWERRDEETNKYEDVLGSNLNARINWGFYTRYLPTPRVAFITGIEYAHRSNGALVQPDYGINVIGPKVAVQYNFAPESPIRHVVVPPPFQPTWDVLVGGSGGVKSVVEQTDPLVRGNFGAFNATGSVQRHFYRYGKIAGGADVTYDGSTGVHRDGADTERRARTSQRWALGVYMGYAHVIGRFSPFAQIGDYVVREFNTPDSTRLYTRYGWRYHFNDRVYSSLAIRTHGLWKANVLELGVGFRIHHIDR